MKILILISELDMGGAETHVEALCYGLVRSGVEVTVASGGGRVADRMIKNGIKHKLIKRPERSPRALLALCHDIYEIIKEERPDAVHAHTRLTAFASHPV